MKLHKQFVQLASTNILLLAVVVYAFYINDFAMIFAGCLMLAVSLLPFYLKAIHDVYVPAAFMYVVVVFIFVSVFLGQFNGLYDRWHWFDSVLHFLSALAFGLMGFLLLFVYYVHNKLKLPKGIIIFFSFFFCLGIGGLWEIIEYCLDNTIGTNMQVGSLDDTMQDLILDGLGGFVAMVVCSIYLSKRSFPLIDNVVKVLTEEIIFENKMVARLTVNDPEASHNPLSD